MFGSIEVRHPVIFTRFDVFSHAPRYCVPRMDVNQGGGGENEHGGNISLTLYVQTPVSGVRAETVDRLTALNAEDTIEAFDVETTRGELIVSQGRDGAKGDLPDEFDALTEWRGPGVRPTFEIESGWTRTGRVVETLSLPKMVLAVYVADGLACVFPCTDGEETWSVADFLDSYESSREPPEGLTVDL